MIGLAGNQSSYKPGEEAKPAGIEKVCVPLCVCGTGHVNNDKGNLALVAVLQVI